MGCLASAAIMPHVLAWRVGFAMSKCEFEAAPVPLPMPVCPLCGGQNACAVARAGSFEVDCWCTRATVAPHVLAAVPAALRNRACLCPRCASGLAGAAEAGKG